MIVKYPREKGGNKGNLQRSALTCLLFISVKLDYSSLKAIRSRYDDIKVWSTGAIPLQIFRRIFFGLSFKGLESYLRI